MSNQVDVGLVLRDDAFAGGARALQQTLCAVERAGMDFVGVLDHVSFWDGTGFDGLVHATAIAAAHPTIPVRTGVYLLPLRHPVAVARQLSTLSVLAPGRFAFGVGIGGEDRREVAAVGVDPATRGRRMDESLIVLTDLLERGQASFRGEFFDVDDVRVHPVPSTRIPILVGGRSDAALRRTARFGDGWVGFAVSPERYARAVKDVENGAEVLGRTVDWQHGMVVWCGFGEPDGASEVLAAEMESIYKIPFAKFSRYAVAGSVETVAEYLREYVDLGCRAFSLIATATPGVDIVDAVGRVKQQLR